MKLKCYKIKRLLNRFIDKELSDEKSLDVLKKHLQDCHDCKKELDYLQMVKGLMSGKERIEAGEGFLVKLKERLRSEPQIIRLKWVTEMGIFSKKLLPVPVVVMILIVMFLFSNIGRIAPAGSDIFGILTTIDANLIEAYFEASNLFEPMVF